LDKNTRRLSKKDIINRAYREITARGIFDEKEGNKPIKVVDHLDEITEKMYEHIENGGKGCCFVFSAYMMEILKRNGIECWMIATKEGDGTRASVLYEDKGELFVANPVEDIEYFTKHNIKECDRGECYIGDTAIFTYGNRKQHDDSRIPLQEFANIYGTVKVIGNFASEEILLINALMRKESKIIAEPLGNNQQNSEYNIGIYDLSKLSLLSRISQGKLINTGKELGEIINRWLKMIER